MQQEKFGVDYLYRRAEQHGACYAAAFDDAMISDGRRFCQSEPGAS